MFNKEQKCDKIYSLQEAVKLYGEDIHKERVLKLNQNLHTNSLERLIKNMKQYYMDVLVIGNGKKREFLCYGIHSEKQERETGHENRSLYYADFEKIFLYKLLHRKENTEETLLMFAKKLNLCSPSLLEDYYKKKEPKEKKVKNYKKIKNKPKKKMLIYTIQLEEEFFDLEISNIRSLVEKAIEQCVKNNKIRVKEVIYCKLQTAELVSNVDEEGTYVFHRIIRDDEWELIKEFDNKIQLDHDIGSQIFKMGGHKDFEPEYQFYFNEIGIDYIYKKYLIEIIDDSNIISENDYSSFENSFKVKYKKARLEAAVKRFRNNNKKKKPRSIRGYGYYFKHYTDLFDKYDYIDIDRMEYYDFPNRKVLSNLGGKEQKEVNPDEYLI